MKAVRMATLFDGISQRLDFKREEGSSSDNSSDDYTSRIRSPKIHSPRIRSPRCGSPSPACRTPRTQRHRSRSRTVGSPLQFISPIPSASWKKLRLCDTPNTPKVKAPTLFSNSVFPHVESQSQQQNKNVVHPPPPEPALQVIPTFLHNKDKLLSENPVLRFRRCHQLHPRTICQCESLHP